jgi:ABC-type nitrate/sulfonate/bicarbonate transport system substrate-binding protein
VRRSALLLALLALTGCGGLGGTGEFGEVPIVIDGAPSADDAGLYFATARGFDEAEGVELQPERSGQADFRLVSKPSGGCVAVQAIVRPDKLVLCVDPLILDQERPKVVAVARALRRGYTQAQLEPDEAVESMTSQVPDLDRVKLSEQLDAAAPTWTEGAPYFGQLAAGPDRDPSIAKDATAP